MSAARILDPSFLECRSPDSLQRSAVSWLGEIASHPDAGSLASAIAGVENHLHDRAEEAFDFAWWHSTVAREVLLALTVHDRAGPPNSPALPESIRNARPFPTSDHRMEEFLEADVQTAACLFPLAESSDDVGRHPLAQVWLVEGGPEETREMEGFERAANETLEGDGHGTLHAYFVSCHRAEDCRGSSWSLDLALCKMALQEDGCPHVGTLASDWLATGTVQNDRIRQVEGMPAKLQTKRNELPHRKFLVPAANYASWPGNTENCFFAEFLETAWNWVTGRGTKDGEPVTWPTEGVTVLHQLVGGAPGVNMATPLLFHTKGVVLWVSDDEAQSKKPARIIDEVLSETVKIPVEEKDIHSASMVLAEQQLRDELEPFLSENETVVFNITSGNRLMSYAAHGLARRFPNLWLVYKDIDSHYTRITYEGDYPVTSKLEVPHPPACNRTPFASEALKKLPTEVFSSGAHKEPGFWTALLTEGMEKAKTKFRKKS